MIIIKNIERMFATYTSNWASAIVKYNHGTNCIEAVWQVSEKWQTRDCLYVL